MTTASHDVAEHGIIHGRSGSIWHRVEPGISTIIHLKSNEKYEWLKSRSQVMMTSNQQSGNVWLLVMNRANPLLMHDDSGGATADDPSAQEYIKIKELGYAEQIRDTIFFHL